MANTEDPLSSLKSQMGNLFGQQPERPPTVWEEVSSSFQLSLAKRVIFFSVFLGLGLFFAGLSTMFLLSPTRFAKFYTLGSIFILSASFFLVGPARQLRSAFQDRSRAISAILYFSTVVLTLFFALSVGSAGLAMMSVIAQVAAAVWYGASYIPFAQSCLLSTARTVLPI
eukprot:m51a1_g2749 hypothetical protein (170) ;mRNA; r:954349-955123